MERRVGRSLIELRRRGLADGLFWAFYENLCDRLREDPRQAGAHPVTGEKPAEFYQIWCDDYLPNALIEFHFEVIDPMHVVMLDDLRLFARPVRS